MFALICKLTCGTVASLAMVTAAYLRIAGGDWTFAAAVAVFSLLGIIVIGEINGKAD